MMHPSNLYNHLHFIESTLDLFVSIDMNNITNGLTKLHELLTDCQFTINDKDRSTLMSRYPSIYSDFLKERMSYVSKMIHLLLQDIIRQDEVSSKRRARNLPVSKDIKDIFDEIYKSVSNRNVLKESDNEMLQQCRSMVGHHINIGRYNDDQCVFIDDFYNKAYQCLVGKSLDKCVDIYYIITKLLHRPETVEGSYTRERMIDNTLFPNMKQKYMTNEVILSCPHAILVRAHIFADEGSGKPSVEALRYLSAINPFLKPMNNDEGMTYGSPFGSLSKYEQCDLREPTYRKGMSKGYRSL